MQEDNSVFGIFEGKLALLRSVFGLYPYDTYDLDDCDVDKHESISSDDQAIIKLRTDLTTFINNDSVSKQLAF